MAERRMIGHRCPRRRLTLRSDLIGLVVTLPPCDLGGLRIDLDSFPFAVSKVVRDFVGTQSASLAPFLLLVWLMLCITVAWCIP